MSENISSGIIEDGKLQSDELKHLTKLEKSLQENSNIKSSLENELKSKYNIEDKLKKIRTIRSGSDDAALIQFYLKLILGFDVKVDGEITQELIDLVENKINTNQELFELLTQKFSAFISKMKELGYKNTDLILNKLLDGQLGKIISDLYNSNSNIELDPKLQNLNEQRYNIGLINFLLISLASNIDEQDLLKIINNEKLFNKLIDNVEYVVVFLEKFPKTDYSKLLLDEDLISNILNNLDKYGQLLTYNIGKNHILINGLTYDLLKKYDIENQNQNEMLYFDYFRRGISTNSNISYDDPLFDYLSNFKLRSNVGESIPFHLDNMNQIIYESDDNLYAISQFFGEIDDVDGMSKYDFFSKLLSKIGPYDTKFLEKYLTNKKDLDTLLVDKLNATHIQEVEILISSNKDFNSIKKSLIEKYSQQNVPSSIAKNMVKYIMEKNGFNQNQADEMQLLVENIDKFEEYSKKILIFDKDQLENTLEDIFGEIEGSGKDKLIGFIKDIVEEICLLDESNNSERQILELKNLLLNDINLFYKQFSKLLSSKFGHNNQLVNDFLQKINPKEENGKNFIEKMFMIQLNIQKENELKLNRNKIISELFSNDPDIFNKIDNKFLNTYINEKLQNPNISFEEMYSKFVLNSIVKEKYITNGQKKGLGYSKFSSIIDSFDNEGNTVDDINQLKFDAWKLYANSHLESYENIIPDYKKSLLEELNKANNFSQYISILESKLSDDNIGVASFLTWAKNNFEDDLSSDYKSLINNKTLNLTINNNQLNQEKRDKIEIIRKKEEEVKTGKFITNSETAYYETIAKEYFPQEYEKWKIKQQEKTEKQNQSQPTKSIDVSLSYENNRSIDSTKDGMFFPQNFDYSEDNTSVKNPFAVGLDDTIIKGYEIQDLNKQLLLKFFEYNGLKSKIGSIVLGITKGEFFEIFGIDLGKRLTIDVFKNLNSQIGLLIVGYLEKKLEDKSIQGEKRASFEAIKFSILYYPQIGVFEFLNYEQGKYCNEIGLINSQGHLNFFTLINHHNIGNGFYKTVENEYKKFQTKEGLLFEK